MAEIISPARTDGRAPDQIRPLRFQNHIAPYATGSTLVEWGNTRVICGVTIEETVPRWMKEQKVEGGWLTAEYSMLPYSTLTRKPRDISKGGRPSTWKKSARAPSALIATCCKPMAARAQRPSPARSSRFRSR